MRRTTLEISDLRDVFPLEVRESVSTLRAMKATVVVMPKASVLDPQGVAVRDAIRHHGVAAVQSVRIGKFIEVELNGTADEAQLHELCRDLLSNPVIEDYELSVQA